MEFKYQTRTQDGLLQAGIIEAISKQEAISILQREGLFVTRIDKTEKQGVYVRDLEFFQKATRKDIMIFSRQLSIMLKSGVALVESLEGIVLQITKTKFKEQIIAISKDVEGGVYFSEALAKYPKVFNNLFINIIRSGEASGKLSDSLNYLAIHLEREYKLINKIRSGMAYPALVSIVFLGIGLLGIFMILPTFEETLTSLNLEIPTLTRIVLSIGLGIKKYWWAYLIFNVLLIGILWKYFSTAEGKEVFGRISIKIPIIGNLVKHTQIARFTENLSTLILAGLPITQALDISSGSISNATYKDIIKKTHEGVRRGEQMSSILSQYPKLMPGLVIQMVRVGERAGALDETLENVAAFYNDEVNRKIDGAIALVEPLLIIFLAGLIGILMVSIIVPVYQGMTDFSF